MRSSGTSARGPKGYSAAELGREAAGLNYDNFEASPSDACSTSELSDRLAILPRLDLADPRLEWRRLFRTDSPRLSRDLMIRAIVYRLQEIADGGASKATQRRLATFAAEFETGGTIGALPGPKIKPGSRMAWANSHGLRHR
jgi:hypothetical protein